MEYPGTEVSMKVSNILIWSPLLIHEKVKKAFFRGRNKVIVYILSRDQIRITPSIHEKSKNRPPLRVSIVVSALNNDDKN